MIAFADTGFYVALLNPRDQLHSIAMTASVAYKGEILTTEYILIELGNYLCAIARVPFVRFCEELRRDTRTEIVRSSSGLFDRAIDLYDARKDKTWSVTDCSSFVMMRERNVIDALTFDRHFEQAGFRNLLERQ
jgi:hypothetical protein